MDEEWATERVSQWIIDASAARLDAVFGGPSAWAMRVSPQMDDLQKREDQVARIVQRVLRSPEVPSLLDVASQDEVEVQFGIELCKRALGVLSTQAETQEKMGSNAPIMQADAMHPLIWEAASKHWDVGHHSSAVQRAATMLNAEVQDRVGRHDVSDSSLMQQTFSERSPEEGKPRLRWPGNDNDLTVKAMRGGILNLSQGVFSAIRNPANHSTEDMERQEALEQLATLSILARWIERCELIEVESRAVR